jgi:putative tricarboxylic transport membrane protein
MLVSQGEMSIFFANKLVGGLTTVALALLLWPLVGFLVAKVRRASA